MIKTVFEHELKNIFLSPKFSAAFAIGTILLLLSVFIGIRQYNDSVKRYNTLTSLNNQSMREQKDWMGLSSKAIRAPEPMQIFVSGINNDIGRYSSINPFDGVKLVHSVYSDDPVYALFRIVDFSFIVTFIFSLLAILFTYDLVNGEKERGTLQLIFSNPVSRSKYIFAKFTGAWIGLLAPLSIPILISIFMLLIYEIPFSSADWLKLCLLLFESVILFTFFIGLGTMISSIVKRSSVSFLIALVCWIVLVFIIPRAGVIIAGQIINVPSIAEIEGQRDGFSKDQWIAYTDESAKRWKERNMEQEGLSKEEREAFRDTHMWEWMEEEDKARKEIEMNIEKYSQTLHEDLRNRKRNQEMLAFSLSRISPVSAYQLAAMKIAGTDIKLKDRYEDEMNQYRTQFNNYRENKRKTSGDIGGIRITMDSDKGFKIDQSRKKGTLDLSDMPKFKAPENTLDNVLSSIIVDSAIILAFSIVAFSLAFGAFLKFDVR